MARIMVVDDSEFMVKAVVRQLQLAGFEASGMTSPLKALMAVLRTEPDLVLLDVNVPELDGPAFCRAVPAATTVVLHSGEGDESLARLVGSWGAKGAIPKNWGVDRKIASIRERLGA